MERRSLLRELLATWVGRIGVALFALLVLTSLYVVSTYPADYGSSRWSNPARWADNPKSVPPAWSDVFDATDHASHIVLESVAPDETMPADGAQVQVHRMPFSFEADEPPTFLSFSVGDVTFHDRPPEIVLLLVRPDGAEAVLTRQAIAGPRDGETPPFRRHVTTPLRVVASEEPGVVDEAKSLLEREYGITVARERLADQLIAALFGQPDPDGRLQILEGDYRFDVRVTTYEDADSVGVVRAVAGGGVFGAMGTDALGRDLAEGLLFGLPVALLIGLAAAALTTVIGATLGLISGYAGGRIDTAIQRLADIVANVPVLPLLIFMVFVLGSELWLILLILVLFGWPGLTIVVRAMVLQLRSGQQVEAARALGATRTRVLARHIFPALAPFIFAQLIFFAPSAILAEAGLSFLGLGDPSIPTWGQILESGFRTGAVFLGYWWWLVPPGLLIVLTAVTFMLLALAMEPVVNPRLRRAGGGLLRGGLLRARTARPTRAE